METKNMPDVQESPASASVETAANYFAALLCTLRRVCDGSGLDFDALAQANGAPEAPKIEARMSQALCQAQIAEAKGDRIEAKEQLLAIRSDVETLAFLLAVDERDGLTGAYIGLEHHLFRSNTRRVLDVFHKACLGQAARLLLTIEMPQFQEARTSQPETECRATLRTVLPLASAFVVVDQDEGNFYELCRVNTWDEAVQAAAEKPVGYNYVRGVYATDADGRLFDSVNLLTTHRCGKDAPKMAK